MLLSYVIVIFSPLSFCLKRSFLCSYFSLHFHYNQQNQKEKASGKTRLFTGKIGYFIDIFRFFPLETGIRTLFISSTSSLYQATIYLEFTI